MMEEKQGAALYFRVKENLLALIKSGVYTLGDKLPTESELCQEYEVSRTTIRQALQQLEIEGYIQRVQGKGTFVSKPKIREPITRNIRTFVEQMKDLGLSAHSKVLELIVIPADNTLAETLHIEEKDPVIKLIRLRYAEDEPLQYVTSYLPWRVAPGLVNEDCSGSLFDLLKSKYDVKIYRSVEAIEPILIEESISYLLEVPAGSPAFSLKSLTYNSEEQPIEYSYGIVRGDRFKFTMERYVND
ncbi:GntR family transcriptional regulator [Paenibacillaceae bacterium]|nr:GntR family transcriptional regulator [Paenibacillaceae bacterium]